MNTPPCPDLFSRRSGHSHLVSGAFADPRGHEKGTRHAGAAVLQDLAVGVVFLQVRGNRAEG
jgi:hypothetical protein